MKKVFVIALLLAAATAFAASWTWQSVTPVAGEGSTFNLVVDSGVVRVTDTFYSDTAEVQNAANVAYAVTLRGVTFADSSVTDSAFVIVTSYGSIRNAPYARAIFTDTLAKDNIDAVEDTVYRQFRSDLFPMDRMYFRFIVTDTTSTESTVDDTTSYRFWIDLLQRQIEGTW